MTSEIAALPGVDAFTGFPILATPSKTENAYHASRTYFGMLMSQFLR